MTALIERRGLHVANLLEQLPWDIDEAAHQFAGYLVSDDAALARQAANDCHDVMTSRRWSLEQAARATALWRRANQLIETGEVSPIPKECA